MLENTDTQVLQKLENKVQIIEHGYRGSTETREQGKDQRTRIQRFYRNQKTRYRLENTNIEVLQKLENKVQIREHGYRGSTETREQGIDQRTWIQRFYRGQKTMYKLENTDIEVLQELENKVKIREHGYRGSTETREQSIDQRTRIQRFYRNQRTMYRFENADTQVLQVLKEHGIYQRTRIQRFYRDQRTK